MESEISIQPAGENAFEVTVREGKSETRHVVTVEPDYARRLAPTGASAEHFLRRSFEFLLEREPKESILPRFNLRDVTRYYPNYEREIRARFGS